MIYNQIIIYIKQKHYIRIYIYIELYLFIMNIKKNKYIYKILNKSYFIYYIKDVLKK